MKLTGLTPGVGLGRGHMPSDPNLSVTLREMARRLDVQQKWLRAEVAAGRIPARRVRGALTFVPWRVIAAVRALRASEGGSRHADD